MTVLGGGAFLGDLEEGAPAAAVALARPIAGTLAAEAELGIVTRIVAPTHRTHATTTMVSGSLVVESRRAGTLVPYVMGGGSLVRLPVPAGAATELALTAGGGVRYAIAGGRWQVRGDVRFVHVNNAPNFWRVLGGVMLIIAD